jgi:2,4-dienoyl-CoA reductase-like NADH-dependent reductase (Old Yellow Enzyme family)
MTASPLFAPITLGGVTLAKRIAVSPMCQYSAVAGSATDWHLQHLGSLSLSSAGMLVLEATAVEPAVRITPRCLRLYSDANEAALAPAMPAARHRPRSRGKVAAPLGSGEGAWQTVASSAIPFGDNWPMPQALDEAGLNRIRDAFVDAARRADRLGFDLVELHGAHGYLLHSFVSPVSNQRTDRYGGSKAWKLPSEGRGRTFESYRVRQPLDLRPIITPAGDAGRIAAELSPAPPRTCPGG